MVLSLRRNRNQFDPAFGPSLIERIAGVCQVVNQTLPIVFQKLFVQGLLDQLYLLRRGAGHCHSQRKPVGICHPHRLGTLAPFGFADRVAPFLPGQTSPQLTPRPDPITPPVCALARRVYEQSSAMLHRAPSVETGGDRFDRTDSVGHFSPLCSRPQDPTNVVEYGTAVLPRTATTVWTAWQRR